MFDALRDIFRINLGVKKHESILVFNDLINEIERIEEPDRKRREMLRCIAMFVAEIGKGFSRKIITYEYPATGSHGAEPPLELWRHAFGEKSIEALMKKNLMVSLLEKTASDSDLKKAETIIKHYRKHAVNCVIALSNYSTSHTRFREFLTRLCGCRYASMPLFDISMLKGAMCVDWRELAKKAIKVAKVLNRADFIEVKSPNGTFISFSKAGRTAISDTGILRKPGSFGNLPAGEVFLAPVEGTATGKLVLEWAPTRKLASPLTLTVRDGYVVNIAGKDKFIEYLNLKLSERHENGNIAELGIGMNNAAKRPDNILESEKILGTIHIALGDNSSFGGKVRTPFHQDFVFFKPTVTLINKNGIRREILKAGKLFY